jgi:hypothetical protein
MFSRYRLWLLLIFVAISPAIARQAVQSAKPAQGAGSSSPGFAARFAAQALTANSSPDTAAVMDLQMKIEDATVRGDVAYVDSVTSPDFTMVHGDNWVTGGLAQLADDKAAYLKRVQDQFYYVHDLDPASIHFEMHKDIAICYGRYLSVGKPQAQSKNPGRISSIWFERVFQKQNGKWVYLSHRTVHGPIPTPAGIDPTAISWDANIPPAQIPWDLNTHLNLANDYGADDPRLKSTKGVPTDKDPTVSKSPEVAEVLAFEKAQEAGVVAGDTALVDKALADDFSMVHGDVWTRGGKAAGVDNKESFLQRTTVKGYLRRDLDSVKVEMHGNVAITYGRYFAMNRGAAPDVAWFRVWYERVFEKQDGQWKFVSHRTVRGPMYGPTRESLENK